MQVSPQQRKEVVHISLSQLLSFCTVSFGVKAHGHLGYFRVAHSLEIPRYWKTRKLQAVTDAGSVTDFSYLGYFHPVYRQQTLRGQSIFFTARSCWGGWNVTLVSKDLKFSSDFKQIVTPSHSTLPNAY